MSAVDWRWLTLGIPVLGGCGAFFADTDAQRNWTIALAVVGLVLCVAVYATGGFWHGAQDSRPAGLLVLAVTVPTAGVAIYLLEHVPWQVAWGATLSTFAIAAAVMTFVFRAARVQTP